MRVVLLGPDQFADLFFDLVHLRKAIEGVLREDLSPIEKNLERSRLTGGDRHASELLVVIVQQVLRQTGGSGQIPSGGAVLDPYGWFLCSRGLAVGAFVCHVVSSVRLRSSRQPGTGCARLALVASVAWNRCQCDRVPLVQRQRVAHRVPRYQG